MRKALICSALLTLLLGSAPAQAQVHYDENPLLAILSDATESADRYAMSIYEAIPGEFTFLRVRSDERHWDYSRRSLTGRRQSVAALSVWGIDIEVASIGIDSFTPAVGGRVGICLLYEVDGLSFDRRLFQARLSREFLSPWGLATVAGTDFDELVIEPHIVNGDARGIQGLQLRSRGSAVGHVDVADLERCP